MKKQHGRQLQGLRSAPAPPAAAWASNQEGLGSGHVITVDMAGWHTVHTHTHTRKIVWLQLVHDLMRKL